MFSQLQTGNSLVPMLREMERKAEELCGCLNMMVLGVISSSVSYSCVQCRMAAQLKGLFELLYRRDFAFCAERAFTFAKI